MADVIRAFGGREELERDGHERGDLVEGARSGRAQERFQFGERQFDRIEVGTVGRQEPELRADGFNRARTSGCLCTARLSRTTTSPGAEGRHQDLFDVGARNSTLSIGPSKTAGAVRPSSRSAAITVLRFPMTARRVIVQPGAREDSARSGATDPW